MTPPTARRRRQRQAARAMTERLTPAQARRLMLQRQRTRLEDDLERRLAAAGLPAPEREYRFHRVRQWRFDFAWKHLGYFGRGGVAVEIDGGIWTRGRHTRGAGYEGDVRKLNAATRLDWKVYHVTASMLDDPQACVRMVREALG